MLAENPEVSKAPEYLGVITRLVSELFQIDGARQPLFEATKQAPEMPAVFTSDEQIEAFLVTRDQYNAQRDEMYRLDSQYEAKQHQILMALPLHNVWFKITVNGARYGIKGTKYDGESHIRIHPWSPDLLDRQDI